jgi:hypothetical protein
LKKGVWVSVPAYSGFVRVETAHALNVETYSALNANIPFMVTFHEQDPIISRCRNSMVMNFLASDPEAFTDMVFVDADVAFPAGTLLRLAQHDVDVVGAVYPYRADPVGFPVQVKNGERVDERGLLKVQGVPAGCLRISRRALEGMIARFPGLEYGEAKVPQGKAYALFDFIRKDGKFCGEDFVFCALAREAGFDVYADVTVPMKHVGMKQFCGTMADALPPEMQAEKEDPMAAIYAFNAANEKAAA